MAKKKNIKNIEEVPKKTNNQSKQLMWILIVIGLVFVVMIVTYFVIIPATNSFSYAGLKWSKIKDNEITWYHTIVPVQSSEGTLQYSLNLRNDPRTNNVSLNNVKMGFYSNLIVSFDPNTEECKGANSLSVVELTKFLGMFGVKATGAIANQSYANAMNVSYATCDNAVNTTVIIVQKSNEPSISQVNDNCYLMQVGDCENIKTTEKFILEILNEINQGRK